MINTDRPSPAEARRVTRHPLAQIPAPQRAPDEHGRIAVLVRTDATKQFAAHLHAKGAEFSVGASLGHFDIHTALATLPKQAWTPAYQATARVEDRIRAAKDIGMRNLPFRHTDQNRIWLAISALATELLAFTARLALPATAALYEPKWRRLRVLAVAGRIVRIARRRTLKIDTAWPWAEVIAFALTRLCTLPVP